MNGRMVSRSQSQLSMASSVSSQAPVGFLGHATKLVNSVLGTSKKGKTELKSLQLAAAAAKKVRFFFMCFRHCSLSFVLRVATRGEGQEGRADEGHGEPAADYDAEESGGRQGAGCRAGEEDEGGRRAEEERAGRQHRQEASQGCHKEGKQLCIAV